MSDAVRFVIVLFLFDIVTIIFLRELLKDFLLGSCSKIGVRNIREKLPYNKQYSDINKRTNYMTQQADLYNFKGIKFSI